MNSYFHFVSETSHKAIVGICNFFLPLLIPFSLALSQFLSYQVLFAWQAEIKLHY